MERRNGLPSDHHAEKGQRENETPDSFLDGPHGKHGGSLESEGTPQEQQPESGESNEERTQRDIDRPTHDNQ
jgi:hypothetical protein